MNSAVTGIRGPVPDLPRQRREEPQTSDFGDFMLAVRRQLPLLIVCTLFGLGLGLTHYVTSPKEYRAASTVLVDERQVDLTQDVSRSVPITRDETVVLNELQILQSLELAKAVVTGLSLHENRDFLFPEASLAGTTRDDLTSWVDQVVSADDETEPVQSAPDDAARIENAANALRSRMDFDRVGRSFAIEISFLSHDPALAADVVNAYSSAYMADEMKANLAVSERTSEWMLARIEELRIAAADASNEAETFRAEMGATDQQGLREREQATEALNELFLTIRQSYERIVMEGTFPVTKGRILSDATMPKTPAEPVLWQLIAIGLTLGGIIGTILATLREVRDTGLRTGEDVREMSGVRFLGYIPDLRTARIGVARATRARQAAPMVGRFASSRRDLEVTTADGNTALAVAEAPDVPSFGKPRPSRRALPIAHAESSEDHTFQNALITADLDLGTGGCMVLGVTSTRPGDGATTIALNLALASAREGRKTVLLDLGEPADGLSSRLGLDGPGIDDVITGEAAAMDALIPVGDDGLFVLPGSRTGRQDRVDLRRSAAICDEIESLRAACDVIVLDLPSSGVSAEAKALLSNIDGLVLASQWGKTRRDVLSGFVDREPELARKVVGAALNRVRLGRLPVYGVPVERSGRSGQAIAL